MFLQSRQVPCQWRGHGCHDWLQVILGFAPIKRPALWPLVFPKSAGYRSDRPPLQVSFFSSTESFVCSWGKSNAPPPPAKWKWKLSPAFSGSRWVPFCCGILRLPILLSHFLAFDCFVEVLLIVKEQSVCLPFFPPSFILWCMCCSCYRAKKIFYKQTSGWRVFGEFNTYIIKYISLNLIFCFPVSFNT